MKKVSLLKLYLTLLLIFTSQLFYAQTSNQLPNIATIYNPQNTTIHPEYTIFHTNDDISTLYGFFDLEELNFIKLADRTYEAKVKIKLIFYESLESTKILDSVSKDFTLNYEDLTNSIIITLNVKAPTEKCKLLILTTDLYNNRKNLNIINFDKTPASSQNLIIIDSASNSPVYTNYIKPYKTYFIKSRYSIDSFYVKKYIADSSIAYPPSASSSPLYKPILVDSFYVKPYKYLKFPSNCVLTINSDSIHYSILSVDEYFPGVYIADQMVYPLKYITSKVKFEEIIKRKNKKIAVDDFWLGLSKGNDNARQLIKIYYNRVLYSNLKFSTTKQGWMTDRGMLYIVYGPPDILHVGDDYEEWIYRNSYNGNKLTYIFDRKYNGISTDYVLRRNTSFINDWRTAIETWESGKLYVY